MKWQSNFIVREEAFNLRSFLFFIPTFKINNVLPSVKASHEWANKDILLRRSYRYRVGKTIGAISGPETAIIYSQSAIVRHGLYRI